MASSVSASKASASDLSMYGQDVLGGALEAWPPASLQLTTAPAGLRSSKRCYDTELADDDTPSKRTRELSLTDDSCLAEEGHVCFGDDGPEAVGPLRRGAIAPAPTAGGSDGSSDTGVLCCAESDVFAEEECSAGPAEDFAVSRAPLSITPSQLPCLSLPLAVAAPPGAPPPAQPQPQDPELADMLCALYASESLLSIVPSYLARHAEATLPGLYLDASMRRTAISWLVEVALEFGLHQETLFLAASLLDRFLSATQGVPRNQLQLISVACMLVAAKHEEELHPSVLDFTSIADNCFEAVDLLRMESLVLECLSFRVNAPTTHTFLSLFKQATGMEPRTCALACYLTELAMLEYDMLAQPPSKVAAAAAVVAKLHFHDVSDLSLIPLVTTYSLEALRPTMRRLLALQSAAFSARDYSSPYIAVRDKFRSHQWFCAAAATPFTRLPALGGAWEEEEEDALPFTQGSLHLAGGGGGGL